MPAFVHRGKTYNNPVQLALEVIGGKWKMPILWRLKDGTLRYGELRTSLNRHLESGRVTDKTLTAQLRELERDGLLRRKVHAVVPPRVDYTITPAGRRVLPVIRALQKLGNRFREGA